MSAPDTLASIIAEMRESAAIAKCWGTGDIVCNYVTDWADRLAALPKQGWWPIESAPRDSSHVLVAYFSENRGEWSVCEAWWSMPWEAAPEKQCSWNGGHVGTMLDRSVHGFGASHWMPLPPPPDGDMT